MKHDNEFSRVEPGIWKTWLTGVLLYVVLLLWLEPAIDFLMSFFSPIPDTALIEAFNQQKQFIANAAFTTGRAFPLLLFVWFGWRVVQTGQLPPDGIKLPFSVKIMREQKARMAGMLIITSGLLLLLREASMLTT